MFTNPNYNFSPSYSGYPYTQNYNTSQPQQSNGINWVQGEAGAKSYAVAPGQSIMLMDSENNVFYIKSTDQSGMPMPLRIFDYSERNQQPQKQNNNSQNEFITRKEFEKRLSELKNAKQSVSTAQ